MSATSADSALGALSGSEMAALITFQKDFASLIPSSKFATARPVKRKRAAALLQSYGLKAPMRSVDALLDVTELELSTRLGDGGGQRGGAAGLAAFAEGLVFAAQLSGDAVGVGVVAAEDGSGGPSASPRSAASGDDGLVLKRVIETLVQPAIDARVGPELQAAIQRAKDALDRDDALLRLLGRNDAMLDRLFSISTIAGSSPKFGHAKGKLMTIAQLHSVLSRVGLQGSWLSVKDAGHVVQLVKSWSSNASFGGGSPLTSAEDTLTATEFKRVLLIAAHCKCGELGDGSTLAPALSALLEQIESSAYGAELQLSFVHELAPSPAFSTRRSAADSAGPGRQRGHASAGHSSSRQRSRASPASATPSSSRQAGQTPGSCSSDVDMKHRAKLVARALRSGREPSELDEQQISGIDHLSGSSSYGMPPPSPSASELPMGASAVSPMASPNCPNSPKETFRSPLVRAGHGSPEASPTQLLMTEVRQKLRAASYGAGGENWEKLFRHFDRNNSGTLTFEEFRSAVRREAKIPPSRTTDDEILTLFHKVAGMDKRSLFPGHMSRGATDSISLQTFETWLAPQQQRNVDVQVEAAAAAPVRPPRIVREGAASRSGQELTAREAGAGGSGTHDVEIQVTGSATGLDSSFQHYKNILAAERAEHHLAVEQLKRERSQLIERMRSEREAASHQTGWISQLQEAVRDLNLSNQELREETEDLRGELGAMVGNMQTQLHAEVERRVAEQAMRSEEVLSTITELADLGEAEQASAREFVGVIDQLLQHDDSTLRKAAKRGGLRLERLEVERQAVEDQLRELGERLRSTAAASSLIEKSDKAKKRKQRRLSREAAEAEAEAEAETASPKAASPQGASPQAASAPSPVAAAAAAARAPPIEQHDASSSDELESDSEEASDSEDSDDEIVAAAAEGGWGFALW